VNDRLIYWLILDLSHADPRQKFSNYCRIIISSELFKETTMLPAGQ